MLYTIQKDSNKSFPLGPILSNFGQRNFEFDFSFNKDCFYPQLMLNGIPYDGYNKCCGIAFKLTKPNFNAAMIGWRCVNNKLYILPYFNVEGANIYGTKEIQVEPEININVKIAVLSTMILMTLKYKDEEMQLSQNFKNTFGFLPLVHIINFWFGGQLPANQTMSANIKLKA